MDMHIHNVRGITQEERYLTDAQDIGFSVTKITITDANNKTHTINCYHYVPPIDGGDND